MTYYGQKNYNQRLGNGSFTIEEAGCLLTAICNLGIQTGAFNVDPPTLNNWFLAHGDYIKDSDGANEDLSWNSVVNYNSNFKVTTVGTSAIPPDTPAIVKFHYQSISHPWLNAEHTQPNMIDHFCLVDHIENSNQIFIVDSWDGLVKSPAQYQAQYHAPVGWATYIHTVPEPVAPVNTTPFAPISIPGSTEKYPVVKSIPGYRSSGQAAMRTNSNSIIPEGSYYIFNSASGMINVTNSIGHPGWWINPGDNVAPTSAPAGPSGYEVPVNMPGYITSNDAANHIDATVTVAAGSYFVFNTDHGMVNVTKVQHKPGAWINPGVAQAGAGAKGDGDGAILDWQATFQPITPATYIALKDITVYDISKEKAPLNIKEYSSGGPLIPIGGTFTGPDGTNYGRTPTAIKNSWWYGIPMGDLELESDVFDGDTNVSTRKVTKNLRPRDYLVIIVAKAKDIIDHIFKRSKK